MTHHHDRAADARSQDLESLGYMLTCYDIWSATPSTPCQAVAGLTPSPRP